MQSLTCQEVPCSTQKLPTSPWTYNRAFSNFSLYLLSSSNFPCDFSVKTLLLFSSECFHATTAKEKKFFLESSIIWNIYFCERKDSQTSAGYWRVGRIRALIQKTKTWFWTTPASLPFPSGITSHQKTVPTLVTRSECLMIARTKNL